MSRSIVLAILLGLLSRQACRSADWPGWRGSSAHGVSIERDLPVTWSRTENIRWRVEPFGKGASSPVVIGKRLYLTAQTDDLSLYVLAYSTESGEPVWKTKIAEGKTGSHELHNMATPTVAANDENLWALFGTGDLACLDHDGKILWKRNLQKVYGDYKVMWGMGTSPILHDGKLYIACMHSGPSYLLCVDGISGRDNWKADRDHGARREARDSYSSPTLATVDGKTQVIVSGADHIDSYDPDTGERIWWSKGLDVPHHFGRTIASPTAAGKFVFTIASGFQNRGYVLAMNADGTGNTTVTKRLWKSSRYSPDCASPLLYYGMAFMIRDDGMASCLNLSQGFANWTERLFADNVKVSPVAADGKIYFLNGRGNCTVVKASKEFEVLAQNDLNESTIASMAISDRHLFIRTEEALYSIGPGE